MATSKTRELLVDVARQLFARIGVENTTMNDIAMASNKGRRTLYTYFKNKNEIYLAVVENELNQLFLRLEEVAQRDYSPEEKLMVFIYTRLEAIKEAVYRNGTLRADFFRDIWRVETVRKQFDVKEIQLIRGILTEGVMKGDFEMPSIETTAHILHYTLRGLDVPYIRGNFKNQGIERGKLREHVYSLVLNGIRKHSKIINNQ
ncbi:TetR/AcrR family transcriptional regulator [Porphyromonadaceae bacterium]